MREIRKGTMKLPLSRLDVSFSTQRDIGYKGAAYDLFSPTLANCQTNERAVGIGDGKGKRNDLSTEKNCYMPWRLPLRHPEKWLLEKWSPLCTFSLPCPIELNLTQWENMG